MTAALLPGAAVFVESAHACTLLQVDSPAQLVPEADLIVIGEVVALDSSGAVLRPEAFLKGPLAGEDIRMERDQSGCPFAPLELNERAMVFVYEAEDPDFPYSNQAYVLKGGQATMEGSPARTEAEVVAAVRDITGQYAVLAVSEEEGAGIDWRNTVLPLGVALAIIFGIGLALMRVWHRIDPS